MSRKTGQKRAVEEEHENHERWLVSYADMITVLMALFIVLYAMSQVDETKYQQLREGLAVGFGHEKSILNGETPVSSAKGASNTAETTYQQLLAQVPEDSIEVVEQIVNESERLRRDRQYGDAAVEVERLLEVWRKIDRALRQQGLREDVRATIDERGLVVSLVSEHIVFEPDIATLTDRGRRVVDTLAPVLAVLTEPIEVDGHTNQEKVDPAYFPTDWELSLARAAHVLRRLEEVHRVPAHRLRATGFGHTKPLIDPARAGSQKINKRVDIIVLSQVPAETRALMTEAYEDVRREAGLDEPPTASSANVPGTDDELPTASGEHRPDRPHGEDQP
ncbi:flagellar motor protein MotB [Nocardioides caeni]|uniref:flagellar motor protein MotB n=1 Tax=Nocardioides caeni TaxID=574700 RepID=UPI0013053A65|nr:flagellar motor protein MotB [Nocardioides caeni]